MKNSLLITNKPYYYTGFSLIELCIVIAILGIFSMFALVAFSDVDEQRDMRAFNILQATMQSVVLQGADRTNSRPADLPPATVITAMPPHTYINLSVDGTGIRAFSTKGKGRSVLFKTNACGDVCMTNITGFATYTLKPIPNQDCARETPPTCNYLAGS